MKKIMVAIMVVATVVVFAAAMQLMVPQQAFACVEACVTKCAEGPSMAICDYDPSSLCRTETCYEYWLHPPSRGSSLNPNAHPVSSPNK